ncbi:membrane hypothetical protein [Nostocoides japonicum T1-X7]|uniref:Uncharacterized protein n=1 Tax=Nostocoides japonicum T1-X7 TaxID=1194083 RepID=A0A077M2D2_9MICO|nr:membrane hypothetical protein [Tetrasphaera japonica T1-X7]
MPRSCRTGAPRTRCRQAFFVARLAGAFLAGADFAVVLFAAGAAFVVVFFAAALAGAALAVVFFAAGAAFVVVFFAAALAGAALAGAALAVVFFAAVVDFAVVVFFAAAFVAVAVADPAGARPIVEAVLGSLRGSATTILKDVPALNRGTEVFLMRTFSPVRGLRPVRAARAAFSKVPKPVMPTLPPLATSRMIVSRTASSASDAAFRLPSLSSRALISSPLFTSSPWSVAGQVGPRPGSRTVSDLSRTVCRRAARVHHCAAVCVAPQQDPVPSRTVPAHHCNHMVHTSHTSRRRPVSTARTSSVVSQRHTTGFSHEAKP